ncbi:hypothetical protein PTTG_29146 [Puccinia triticina 1-1 BBBD Race 1]|uniref:Uncharacterized protein n=1 Tax=Puccinia triticina (isolate 1-1 / race 1 (BBBD)) TaxID=630390 RepID=A0A180G676_PUCT1|nr:hypothetical protein PTTG_29146 [Puccinia triticina 1-1 BBBD Race 1]
MVKEELESKFRLLPETLYYDGSFPDQAIGGLDQVPTSRRHRALHGLQVRRS